MTNDELTRRQLETMSRAVEALLQYVTLNPNLEWGDREMYREFRYTLSRLRAQQAKEAKAGR